MNLVQAIKKVISDQGRDMLFKPTLVGLLDDYGAFLQEKPATKEIFTKLVQRGCVKKMANFSGCEKSLQFELRSIVFEISDSFGYRESLISDILMKIALGVSLISSEKEWLEFQSDTNNIHQLSRTTEQMNALDADELDSEIARAFPNSLPVTIMVRTDVPAVLYCDGEHYAQLDTNIPASIHCTIGLHIFSFVSTEFSTVVRDVEKEYVESGLGEPIIISLSAEVEKARKQAEKKAKKEQENIDKANRQLANETERQRKLKVKNLERDARAREKALVKSAKKKIAETTLFDLRTEDERRAYNEWKDKQVDWEMVAGISILVMGILFLISLVLIVLGWIKGTGHAGIWNWTLWCSLGIGLVLWWLFEGDVFDN